MSNQGGRIEGWASTAGIAPGPYEGTFLQCADFLGVPAGDYTGRMVAYLQQVLGSSGTSLPGLQAEAAIALGHTSWNEVGADITNLHFTPGADLVTNGTFDTDLSGWTTVQWIQFLGSALLQGDILVDQPLSQDITTVGGERYLVKFDLGAIRPGAMEVTFGGESLVNHIPSPDATPYSFITAPVTGVSNTISFIGLAPETDPQFLLDNVTVQQIIPA